MPIAAPGGGRAQLRITRRGGRPRAGRPGAGRLQQQRVQRPAGRQPGDQLRTGDQHEPGPALTRATSTSPGTSSGPAAGTRATIAGNVTPLLNEWAACERSHGDPDQTDPTVSAGGVIYIRSRKNAQPAGDLHERTGTCSQYVAEAANELRAANPVAPPPDQAELLKYVACMRANGVPNYPYPDGDQTNFNGTGVDPNSPAVVRVNDLCGKKIGAPAWWINGTHTTGRHRSHHGRSALPPAEQRLRVGFQWLSSPPGRSWSSPPSPVPWSGGWSPAGWPWRPAATTTARPRRPAAAARSPPRQWCGPTSLIRCRSAAPSATTAPTPSRPCTGGGVYTWLPEPGAVIKQDQPVYSVGNVPVPLLYGSLPAYRQFDAGMSDGADVGQLTRDLIALGYGDGLAQSDHYSSATAAAVQRWQKALGLQATGEIPLGEAVFEPGPIRVTSVTPDGRHVRRGRHRADRHQHHPCRRRRPGRERGVPGQAGRRGDGRAARRHHDRGRAHRDGRHRGDLPGRGRRRRRRRRQRLGGPVAVRVQRVRQRVGADGDGHHHPGQHPGRRHLRPGPGERQHHHADRPATSWPCR